MHEGQLADIAMKLLFSKNEAYHSFMGDPVHKMMQQPEKDIPHHR
jgi:hypothetical protein